MGSRRQYPKNRKCNLLPFLQHRSIPLHLNLPLLHFHDPPLLFRNSEFKTTLIILYLKRLPTMECPRSILVPNQYFLTLSIQNNEREKRGGIPTTHNQSVGLFKSQRRKPSTSESSNLPRLRSSGGLSGLVRGPTRKVSRKGGDLGLTAEEHRAITLQATTSPLKVGPCRFLFLWLSFRQLLICFSLLNAGQSKFSLM